MGEGLTGRQMQQQNSVRGENVIGSRLFKQALMVAIGLTIVLTAAQVWLNYRNYLTSIQNTLDQIELVQVQGISTALWNYSMPELSANTTGITYSPYITYAEVRDERGIVVSAGKKKSQNIIEKEIPLMHEQAIIGTLYFQADLTLVNLSVFRQVIQIFAFQALNVLFTILILLLLVDRQVIRHLNDAANFFSSFQIQNLNVPLQLEKQKNGDEIDWLVDEFNRTQKNLAVAYEQLDESERKHSTLLTNLVGMAFRCRNDRLYTMEVVSAGCIDLTGYKPEDLIENRRISFYDLIYPDDHESVWETIQKELMESQAYELTYRIQSKDGQIKWVWERGVGVYTDQGELRAIEGFIVDITEKRQQERELEVIASVSLALRGATTLDEILPVILDQTMKLLNADGGALELIDPRDGDAVVELAKGGYENLKGMRIRASEGLNNYIRRSGKPYLNNFAQYDPMNLNPEIDAVYHAAGGVPMIAHGLMIGFLWIGRKSSISENAIRALVSIADYAANAIYRVNLYDQSEQHLKQLIGLRKIDMAINSNRDLPETIGVVLEQTLALLHADAVNVLALDPDLNAYTYKAGLGFKTQYFEQNRMDLGDGCEGNIILSKTPIKIYDLSDDLTDPDCHQLMIAEGFRAYFGFPLVAQNEVKGVIQVFMKHPFYPDVEWVNFLETLAGQAAIVVSEAHLVRNLQRSNQELKMAYDATIIGWSSALDLRDSETEGHSQRVAELSVALAKLLGLASEELIDIHRGALLHDIGKVGVPDNILKKPGKLNKDEWIIMRKHPFYAYRLLSPIEYLRSAIDIPYCHHEKWDGSGYPRGLKGEEIPLAARIFAVVDVWDALTSDRPYREAMKPDEAFELILSQSGKHFDPVIVDLFKNLDPINRRKI
jgi:PAS domain S-box-containing protein